MNHPTIYKLSILAVALLAGVIQASARPVDFSELSLLVRAQESENSIRQEVAERKLMHALTPQQESKLKAQGASDSLVQALRNPNLVIPKEEAARLEAAREQKANTIRSMKVEVMPKLPVSLWKWCAMWCFLIRRSQALLGV